MTIANLSFAEEDATDEVRQVPAWRPQRTGDYSKDCRLGRQLFAEVMEHMKTTGNVYTLMRVIEAQVEEGTFDGVEIGFHQALTERLGFR